MSDPSDETVDRATHERAQEVGSRSAVLLLHGPEGVQTVPLEPGVETVVGRAGDVAIADASLSRRHASFLLVEDGVRVRDLRSRNGTHFRGARVEEARIAPGEAVTLGEVTITLSMLSRGAPLLRERLASEEGFFGRLEAACAAARGFARPFALLHVRALADVHVTSWIAELRAALRPADVITLHGRRAVYVVLPETSEQGARSVARTIAGADATPLAVGVATRGDGPFERMELARHLAMRADVDYRVPIDEETPSLEAPVVASEALKQVFAMASSAARSNLPVLILGETGVGKDVVARSVHRGSARAEGVFYALNCAALAESVLEAELFGHVRGAFTGADTDRPGIFERAHGGTLFLDEVAELSPRAQSALLRAIETGAVRRMGSEETIETDVRVVAATHVDLESAVEAGRFRRDLFFRLNPLSVRVPPLRERPEDLDALLRHFLEIEAEASGVDRPRLAPEVRVALRGHSWPGNVRELRNAVARAVLLAGEAPIELTHLPPSVRGEPGATADQALRERMQAYEAELIRDALRTAKGNRRAAAELLQIPVRTLSHKMKQLGISPDFTAG